MPWTQFYDLPERDQRRLRAELSDDPEKYDFLVRPSGMLSRSAFTRELVRRQTLAPVPAEPRSKGDLRGFKSAHTFHLDRS